MVYGYRWENELQLEANLEARTPTVTQLEETVRLAHADP